MTDARVSRVFAEVLTEVDPDARVSNVFAEVLTEVDPDARVSNVFAEVLVAFDPDVLEVWNPPTDIALGSYASVQWEVVFTETVTLTAVGWKTGHLGTYTFYVDGVSVGTADGSAMQQGLNDDQYVQVKLATPKVVVGGATVTIRVDFPSASSMRYNDDLAGDLEGSGLAYIQDWHNARWPHTGTVVTSESAAGMVQFELGAAATILEIGRASETDQVFALTVAETQAGVVELGQITETTHVFALGRVQALARVEETGSAQALAITNIFQAFGSWSWWTRPRAVAFGGKIYLGSASMAGPPDGIVVDEYLATDASFVERHIISDDEPFFDDHNNPAIVLRSGEPPLVIWSRHAGETVQRIATGDQDIDLGFSVPTGAETTLTFAADQSYSVIHQKVDGTLIFISRSGPTSWSIRTSSDWGATWTPKRTVVSMTGQQMYMASALAADGRVILAATAHPRFTTTQEIYYAEIDPVTFHVYKLDGTDLGIAGTSGAPALLTDWTVAAVPVVAGYRTWIYDITEDGDGNPEIVYSEFNDDDPINPATSTYRYVKLVGGSWVANDIVAAGDSFGLEASADDGGSYLGGAQFAQSGSVLVSREEAGTWYVEYHHTTDDGDTWTVDLIAEDDEKRLARAWKVESVDGTEADWVAINAVTPPFDSYWDHISGVLLYPAPTLPQVLQLGQVSETSSAQSLAVDSTFDVELGRALEVDEAVTLTLDTVAEPQDVLLGQSSETSEAGPFGLAMQLRTGVDAPDVAMPLTVVRGAVVNSLTRVGEGDEAHALVALVEFSTPVGRATETSAPRPLGLVLALDSQDTVEVALPLEVAAQFQSELTRASEVSLAESLAVDSIFTGEVGQASTLEAARLLGLAVRLARVGTAEEASVLALVRSIVRVRLWHDGQERQVELLGVKYGDRIIPAHVQYWAGGRIIDFEREVVSE